MGRESWALARPSPEGVAWARDWFSRGTKAVFLARLVPGVRSLISIPAGACGMHLGVFLWWTALGTFLWSALLAWAGARLGDSWEQVDRFLAPVSWLVVGGLPVWYVVHVWRREVLT